MQILKRKINSMPKEMKKVYSVEPIKKAEPAFSETLTWFLSKRIGLMGTLYDQGTARAKSYIE